MIRNFEDLIAWQKARELTRGIYDVTKRLHFSKDFALSTQIQKAAVSVMANIAEGYERASFGEFHRFLSIAKGSCAELRSHLYVALDNKYITKSEFQFLQEQAETVGKVIGGLRASVAKKRNEGKET